MTSLPSQKTELLWLVALVINILITVASIAYDIGILAARLTPHSPACYASGLLTILSWIPILITIASISALITARNFYRIGEYGMAQALAWSPLLIFLAHLLFYRLSPCWL